MKRRQFTTALATAMLTATGGMATILPQTLLDNLDDREAFELLQIPRLPRLGPVLDQAQAVLRPNVGTGGRPRGLSLIVTPRLNTDSDRLHLDVSVEVTDLSRPLITFDGNAASAPRVTDPDLDFQGNVYLTGDPALLVRRADTTVRVQDGATLIMGGLYHRVPDQSVTRDAQLPFFRNLPVVGHMFRRGATESRANTLMIFITPRIIIQD